MCILRVVYLMGHKFLGVCMRVHGYLRDLHVVRYIDEHRTKLLSGKVITNQCYQCREIVHVPLGRRLRTAY